MSKAIVLLSGGQDSTTCLYWAKARYDDLVAVSFFYNQRHQAELGAAVKIAADAGARHRILDMSCLAQLADSALLADSAAPILGSGGRPDDTMPEGLPTSFVPGRNLLFISAACALAVKEGSKDVVTGTCETDFSGYPDCRREFIDALEVAASLAMPSSSGPILIHTPLMHLTKAKTVKLARAWPGCWEALALSVTCYLGQRPGCGACPACSLRAKGFAEAGEVDPAQA